MESQTEFLEAILGSAHLLNKHINLIRPFIKNQKLHKYLYTFLTTWRMFGHIPMGWKGQPVTGH